MSICKRLLKAADAIGCFIIGPFFVGGWSVESVLKKGTALKRQGYGVTYTLLGEHVVDQNTVDRALQTTLQLMAGMDKSNRGNVAIKPTLYGLYISKDLFHKTAEQIICCAMAHSIEVEFDSEMSSVMPDTFEIFSEFANRFPHRNFVRQCVQAHLVDIFDLMDEYELWDKQLRIVKGAGVYDESSEVVLADSGKVMDQYWAIVERNYSQEGQIPYIATMRDEDIPSHAATLSPKSYIRPYRPIIQMLYGPRGRGLRKKMLREGRDVKIYIPYVRSYSDFSWFGYGLRRASMMRRLMWEEIKKTLRCFQLPEYMPW